MIFFILFTCATLSILRSVTPFSQRIFSSNKFYLNNVNYAVISDPNDNMTPVERFFFNRFASSVAREVGFNTSAPTKYKELITMISQMASSNAPARVHDQGKNILVRLFPPTILPLYRLSFAKFPRFSAWMNTQVTHYTTRWLMGNSTVKDLELANGEIVPENCLYIEKCIFLEEAGCLKTCIHSCKIPTQRFFMEEMGLPVTLRPNVTDYSCKFEFGVAPPPLALDEISRVSCLDICNTRQGSSNRLDGANINNNLSQLRNSDVCAIDKYENDIIENNSTPPPLE